jgi:endonuclease/exonuclease/phosphatase family metal-dependent hydrolase
MADLNLLSFCTFNLLNLNKPGKAIYTDADGWTEEEYLRKVAWAAQQLRVLDADVYGFEELWHADALGDVFHKAGLADQYDLVTPEDAKGTRIVCAGAVRKGLLSGDAKWINDFPAQFRLASKGGDAQTPAIAVNLTGFSRPVLRFEITPRADQSPVMVYVCHFKSKGPTDIYREDWFVRDVHAKHASAIGAAISTIRRTAEATALRIILTEQLKGNDVPAVIMGDINDGQHSNTANILTEQPRYLVGDSEGGGDIALYTAQTLQEYRDTRDVYYTHVHQGVRESLDHIFVTQEFYDNSKKRIWMFHDMVIMNDHLNFADKTVGGTSDHGIVKATFKYRPVTHV